MNEKYDPKKTALKAAPPIISGVLAEVVFFVCQRYGLDVPRDQLYQLAIVLCGGYLAIINAIKNIKKK